MENESPTPEQKKHLRQIRRKDLIFLFKQKGDRVLQKLNEVLPWLILAYLILN